MLCLRSLDSQIQHSFFLDLFAIRTSEFHPRATNSVTFTTCCCNAAWSWAQFTQDAEHVATGVRKFWNTLSSMEVCILCERVLRKQPSDFGTSIPPFLLCADCTPIHDFLG